MNITPYIYMLIFMMLPIMIEFYYQKEPVYEEVTDFHITEQKHVRNRPGRRVRKSRNNSVSRVSEPDYNNKE